MCVYCLIKILYPARFYSMAILIDFNSSSVGSAVEGEKSWNSLPFHISSIILLLVWLPFMFKQFLFCLGVGLGVIDIAVSTEVWHKVVDWIFAFPFLSVQVRQKGLALGLLINLDERWNIPGTMLSFLIVQVIEGVLNIMVQAEVCNWIVSWWLGRCLGLKNQFVVQEVLRIHDRFLGSSNDLVLSEVGHEVVLWMICWCCLGGIPEVAILLLSSTGIIESRLDITIDSKVWHKIVLWMLCRCWSSRVSELMMHVFLHVGDGLLRGLDFLVLSEVGHEVVNWVTCWCSLGGFPEMTLRLFGGTGIIESRLDITIDSKVWHIIVLWMLCSWCCRPKSELVAL